jgi:oxygen-independent coproporphyrinogen-3 oxidase
MSLGLYVHLPFCRTHCTYCPFVISTDLSMQDAYVDALVKEIAERASGEHGYGTSQPRNLVTLQLAPLAAQPLAARPAVRSPVDTVYFGGGTPSRTSLANLACVVSAIRAHFDVAADAEFTLEVNPEDVDDAALEAWRTLGVNRLSIGVQSFHDDELAPLARLHGRDGALDAVRRAVASGLRTNLDLILGLPRQTPASFRENLDLTISLGVGHVSMYLLDLEEKTPLQTQVSRGRTTLPDEDDVASLYVEAVERFAKAGLIQYEVSNFARAGEESRHNLRYWQRREYHGFGIGAHSFLGTRRFANTRDLHRYVERAAARDFGPDFTEELGEREATREALLLGLRQTAGLESDDVIRLCGEEGRQWIERGIEDGWLRRNDSRVAFTPAGFLLSNDYISRLF